MDDRRDEEAAQSAITASEERRDPRDAPPRDHEIHRERDSHRGEREHQHHHHRDRSDELCRDFQRGHCRRGPNCPFIHKDPPDDMPPRRREACRDFLRGNCPRGTRCIYSHQVQQGFKEVCRDFNRGSCPRGSECTYAHTVIGRDGSPPPRAPPPEHDDLRYPPIRKRPRYEYETPSSPVCTISTSELEYLLQLKSEVSSLREDNRYLRDENRALRRELRRPERRY